MQTTSSTPRTTPRQNSPQRIQPNAADKEDSATEESSYTLPSDPFPEGGFQAWCTVAGATIVQFCGFGLYTTSYGVYQGQCIHFYRRDYLTQSSSSAISWIGSINVFILVSGGLICGRLFDRGYFRHLVYGGIFIQCFSLFMLSLCQREQYYQIFLAQGLGIGIGAAMLYLPSIAVISHYFHKRRRALAMTIVASGSSLGAAINPIMLNNTLHRMGFANAVRASAGLITGLLLIASLLMRTRLPPPERRQAVLESLPRFARDLPYVLAVIGMTFYQIGFYFLLFYLQLDSISHGNSETFSFYSLVIMNAASFVGRLSPGFFAHRFGVLNMITFSAGAGGILVLCMIALGSLASVVVIAVLFGYSVGVFVTLMAPLFAVLTDDMGELGLRMGVGFGVVGLGCLIGPPINGALLTSNNIWWRPAVFSGIMALIGFSFLLSTIIVVRRKSRIAKETELVEKGEKREV
ncbi:MFS general substrate transporter [Favolaschia claudopus]|uniref:MFS general substrate transporter n=1 Tax=Favolaschia claudopus TaxID=2862362 RepID=A0AAW0AYG2_9AGAR